MDIALKISYSVLLFLPKWLVMSNYYWCYWNLSLVIKIIISVIVDRATIKWYYFCDDTWNIYLLGTLWKYTFELTLRIPSLLLQFRLIHHLKHYHRFRYLHLQKKNRLHRDRFDLHRELAGRHRCPEDVFVHMDLILWWQTIISWLFSFLKVEFSNRQN